MMTEERDLCVFLGVVQGTPYTDRPTKEDYIAALESDPDLAWEVVKDLAPRLAGPWILGHSHQRRQVYYYMNEPASVLPNRDSRGVVWTAVKNNNGIEKSVEAAREAADAALVKAGYILAGGTNG